MSLFVGVSQRKRTTNLLNFPISILKKTSLVCSLSTSCLLLSAHISSYQIIITIDFSALFDTGVIFGKERGILMIKVEALFTLDT